MKRAILMSIRPQHLVKILNGEKTIEIRKTMPKCELPIDVYLYCTKGKKNILYKYKDKYYTQHYLTFTDSVEVLNSKVVATFTLNKCYELEYADTYGNSYFWKNTVISGRELCKKSCLDDCELDDYSKGKTLFAWHIDNLVIFDKPKELREFSIFKRETISCGMDCPPYTDWVEYRVRKAPKSWQYVYVEDEV